MSWFGFGKGEAAADSAPSVEKALPASWYRSKGMYELERRSIFSKKWMVVSHKLRFLEAGDFIQVTEAGFPFFLIKDRDGNINGFHNVCRHRAYPVVEKDCGRAAILACKYHGWSYGFKGNLAKAPKYQDVAGFDKSANGLYKVHVHVDKLGFVWVNLDASSEPTIPWDKDFGDVDCQPRLQAFDLTQFHFDHQWEMVGDYNWKTLADNYNECYHCPTGHPGVASVADLGKYWVETKKAYIQHWNTNKDGAPDGVRIYSTFYYPNASITVAPHFFYIMRNIPISASQTKMEYEVYRLNTATDEEFKYISDFYRVVLREDKDLCNAAQKNLNNNVFMNGELHPHAEKGPLFFQKLTRELVMSHHAAEERNGGKQIWPATPAHAVSDKGQEEVEFCSKLDCATSSGPGELAW